MKQDGKLKLGFPSQGWKQFHTARKEMLSAYDAAKEKGKKHKVSLFSRPLSTQGRRINPEKTQMF